MSLQARLLSFVCAHLLGSEHFEGAGAVWGGGPSEDQGQRGQPGRIPVSDPRPTIQRNKEKEADVHRKTGPKEDSKGHYPELKEFLALLKMRPTVGKHPRCP